MHFSYEQHLNTHVLDAGGGAGSAHAIGITDVAEKVLEWAGVCAHT
jgi:hypothetical protein